MCCNVKCSVASRRMQGIARYCQRWQQGHQQRALGGPDRPDQYSHQFGFQNRENLDQFCKVQIPESGIFKYLNRNHLHCQISEHKSVSSMIHSIWMLESQDCLVCWFCLTTNSELYTLRSSFARVCAHYQRTGDSSNCRGKTSRYVEMPTAEEKNSPKKNTNSCLNALTNADQNTCVALFQRSQKRYTWGYC